MAFGRFNNSAPPIAIEFGVHSLKALQIEPGNPPRLVAAGCIEPPEALRRLPDVAEVEDRLLVVVHVRWSAPGEVWSRGARTWWSRGQGRVGIVEWRFGP